jgi:hypothetical protein
VAAEHLSGPPEAAREAQLRHWTAEAMAIVSERIHWDLARMSREPGFRADVRWIAEQTGTAPDQVNIAFARLLRLGLMETTARGAWTERTQLPGLELTEAAFRKLALERVRQKAAEANIQLRGISTRKT